MELREWLIILGLALVTLIVIDGVRRLQRQRRVPRLDQVERDPAGHDADPDAEARMAEMNWELPNGGARVVRPADDRGVQPKPKLERQEHPGPSRVLSEFRRHHAEAARPHADTTDERKPSVVGVSAARGEASHRDPVSDEVPVAERGGVRRESREPEVKVSSSRPDATAGHHGVPVGEPAKDERREPALSGLDLEMTAEEDVEVPEGAGPLTADPEDHDAYADEEQYRLVDLEGMGDSFKSGSKRVGSSVQRFGASLQKSFSDRREHKRSEKVRREQERSEKAAREAA